MPSSRDNASTNIVSYDKVELPQRSDIYLVNPTDNNTYSKLTSPSQTRIKNVTLNV